PGRGARRPHTGREPRRRRSPLRVHAAARASERRRPGPARREGMSRPQGARILVVDDEPAILRVVSANLVRHGFQAETAETGQHALRAYRQRPPDLILLDLGLPDMDGLEVIRAVRAQSSTPIVVLTVRGGEREKVAALDLGADDYVTKPFGVEELLARIRVELRHAARPARGAEAVFRTGELSVDLEHRRGSTRGGAGAPAPPPDDPPQPFLPPPHQEA